MAHPPGHADPFWPQFIYHVTDIVNAVNILKRGRILSREAAAAAGYMKHDNASALVMRQTNDAVKRFARFYFRPRTPTQYQNEGFRPEGQRKLEARRSRVQGNVRNPGIS